MKTKKIVIIGGPSTGKSSIINTLIDRGFTCFEEVSRQITLKAREAGIEQLFLEDPLAFSEALLKGRIEQFKNAQLTTKDFVFLDRGIPDIPAYMDYVKQDYPNHFKSACVHYKYDFVFILKPWKTIHTVDNERYESFEEATKIHNHLVSTYKSYGYHLIEVPIDSISARADYILNAIKA